MSKETIKHKGRVTDITPEITTVEIISESACASCHAKGLCGMSESKVKEVLVRTSPWGTYGVGDEVTLELKATMGQKAVMVGYGIPLVILMAVLLILFQCGAGELAAGLSAIAAVAVYYFVIWLLRDKLRNEYIFNIISDND